MLHRFFNLRSITSAMASSTVDRPIALSKPVQSALPRQQPGCSPGARWVVVAPQRYKAGLAEVSLSAADTRSSSISVRKTNSNATLLSIQTWWAWSLAQLLPDWIVAKAHGMTETRTGEFWATGYRSHKYAMLFLYALFWALTRSLMLASPLP